MVVKTIEIGKDQLIDLFSEYR